MLLLPVYCCCFLFSAWEYKLFSCVVYTVLLVVVFFVSSPIIRGVKRDLQIAQESSKPQPHVDYSLKAGQKISLNLSVGSDRLCVCFILVSLVYLQKKIHDDDDEDGSRIKPLAKPQGWFTIV